MIRSEYQTVIECDDCGESWSEAATTQNEMIKLARSKGWSYGKRILCPHCKIERKRNSK